MLDTRFIRVHPAGTRKGRPPAQSESRAAAKVATLEAPRILVVEDLLLAAWHLESLLIDLGYEVCGLAANGQDAIEQAADSNANTLLMDLNLGEGIDGIETARRISEGRSVSVVFITAYSDPGNVARIKQAFPDAPVLTKPVTRDGLHAAIRAARKS